MVRIGFVKVGNIATSPMVELLLDERAEREDMEVRVLTSGANMGAKQSEDVAKSMIALKPDVAFVASPNASTKGPTRAREVLAEAGIPVVVITDGPGKLLEELGAKGLGGIIVEADSMIGARREFLDPIEMAIFNADTTKVLSVTGVYNVVYAAIDAVIEQLKAGKKPELPLISVTSEMAIEAAGFSNPYARAKAAAAYEMARRVASLTTRACFREKDWEVYTALCAAAHELMRSAAVLADEAREIEKYGDSVLRRPHFDDGSTLEKRRLIEKPR
ncbi:methylenetetrahydromethanopterin dehydrogenase [miscellaneous Crenarchaeota group-15 archaeon DG-45]|uniref:F420-dependent methylenetetrahydromethanopterin dehydrogenase n=1 Tax=miscellaneous Crenarchaeota group-15 archaeon DG-45 TaxID=1685127 RepID=A0A0M0BRF6_9ARCH|nr:MAG: methylenetetrahydromethanopterin dehydrogenase [miscellaneous Crenarchaeota group-15 archaeon DG-45]